MLSVRISTVADSCLEQERGLESEPPSFGGGGTQGVAKKQATSWKVIRLSVAPCGLHEELTGAAASQPKV